MHDLTIKQLLSLVMQQAREKGFGTRPGEINVAEKIALIHTEISEAFEAYRHKNIEGKNGFKEELGDAIQRIFHLCGVFDINIEDVISEKLKSNKNRKWDWRKMNEKHS